MTRRRPAGGTTLPLVYPRVKRAIDVALSAGALVALAPVMAFTAVAVRLDSPGPVVFRQERLGLGGRPFTMYKFRSMRVGAEAGGVYEAIGDVRVTRLGHLLRRTSLDELPQLVNIIKGDMSIIGPRPTLTYHPWPFEQYSLEQRRRFDVRPGVTGWAQVSGRKSLDWHRRIQLDVEYVDSMSPAFDARILFKTVAKVLAMSDNVNISRTASHPEHTPDSSEEGPQCP